MVNSRKSNDVIQSARILCNCAKEILDKANLYSSQFDKKDSETCTRLDILRQKIESLTQSLEESAHDLPPNKPVINKPTSDIKTPLSTIDENGKLDQVTITIFFLKGVVEASF